MERGRWRVAVNLLMCDRGGALYSVRLHCYKACELFRQHDRMTQYETFRLMEEVFNICNDYIRYNTSQTMERFCEIERFRW